MSVINGQEANRIIDIAFQRSSHELLRLSRCTKSEKTTKLIAFSWFRKPEKIVFVSILVMDLDMIGWFSGYRHHNMFHCREILNALQNLKKEDNLLQVKIETINLSPRVLPPFIGGDTAILQ